LNEQTPRPAGSGEPGRRPRGPARRRRPRGTPPSGQAFAENRSRPIYPEQSPRGGNRRRPFRSNGSGTGGRPNGPQGTDPNRSQNRGRPAGGPRSSGGGYSRGTGSGNGSSGGYRAGRPSGRPGGRPYGAQGYRNDRRNEPPPRTNGGTWAGPQHIEENEPVLPSDPREAALRVLYAVDARGAFSDRVLDSAPRGADPRDMALLRELVKGTLRWRGRLDYVLDQIVHIGIQQVQPWIKNVLRLGAYQILFLERVPAHAAVDESVKLAHRHGHPGTAGLVNSVLRRLAENKDAVAIPDGDDLASLAVWGSHPEWLVERWLARMSVAEVRELMLANNRAAAVGLRVNALRGTRKQLIEKLAAEGHAAEPARFAPDLVWLEGGVAPASLKAFREGWCTAQDESEALVSRLVAPEPHERLLDLCAAPGGKCTHLAELMGDEGEVWAVERAPERVASLQTTVDRLGAHAVHVVQGDGRSYTFPMPFDRVLVDAPCSGLGVLARRADARWRKGPEILREMPPIQLELLAAGGRRARPGGVLVYSVCSFEPEETTEVVERFLAQNPSFVLESVGGRVPDEVVDDQGFLCVLPHRHGCDGAFAARFRKT
jgi:16S rRNA (cytosine967-C5)-methyltransferase